MSNSFFTEYGPEIAEDIFEVGSHFIGREIIQTLKRKFTGDGNARRGDFYMNQSRAMLQRHLQMMSLDEQTIIRQEYTHVKTLRKKAEDAKGSRLKRYFLAMEYKRLSKETFKLVEEASNRAVDDNLMDQMDEAMQHAVGPQSVPKIFLQSTRSNPFSDSHGVSSVLSGVSIGGVDQVNVETYHSEATGGAAVVLGFHRQDAPTQHIVATFSATAFSNPSADSLADLTAETSSVSVFGENEVYGPPSEIGEAIQGEESTKP